MRELLHALAIRHAVDFFTSWMRTSTSATRSPVRRSTSVLHAVPQRRRHLGEVQPVLDDHVELDRDSLLGVAADRDPLA